MDQAIKPRGVVILSYGGMVGLLQRFELEILLRRKSSQHHWVHSFQALEGGRELTGIKGSPKMFRKTKSTYDEEDFVKRYGKKEGQENAIILSDHDQIGTAQKHYWKISDSRRKELAEISDKLFTFPRVVNN